MRNIKPALILATHNKHKVAEFQILLPEFELRPVSDFGLASPEETGDSFRDNAKIKSLAASRATSLCALADDSGLAVLGLDGFPGVHSARWAEEVGTYDQAMKTITRRLVSKYGSWDEADKRAEFVASLCLSVPDGDCQFFDGRTYGTVTFDPHGDNGFGYDPFFQPDGYDQTFGQMAPEQKNSLSHRSNAIAELRNWLEVPSVLRDRLFCGR